MLADYFPILIFLCTGLVLGAALMGLGFLLGVVLRHARADREKQSAYECGFDPFENARMKFDVRYYLIAILFILFDLEIAFLFPWAVALDSLPMAGFWAMMVFLAVLMVGFVYEWRRGALEWE